MTPIDFSHRLLTWYDQHGRKRLPWQQPVTPYRVWVSEIMLQQTQVKTVIPYFERFMARFADVHQLAQAPLDAVMQHWAGLGYYSRARNLHAAAGQLVNCFNGVFPKDVEQIASLPGIGRSTAGAIAAISLGVRAPILDGNVKRVLTRVLGIAGWPGKSAVNQQLWQQAEYYTPKHRIAEYTQAIMDLGAMLCIRKPDCSPCPLREHCVAYNTNTQHQYPEKKPSKIRPTKHIYMIVQRNTKGAVWMYKRPPKGIWGGLWSLPELSGDTNLQETLMTHTNNPILRDTKFQVQGTFKHTFSHYHLMITPVQITLYSDQPLLQAESGFWYAPQQSSPVGVAAPVGKILANLEH